MGGPKMPALGNYVEKSDNVVSPDFDYELLEN